MIYVGMDLGSTAAKVVVMNDKEIIDKFVLPTGWNCVETADIILKNLLEKGYKREEMKIVGTGYGRISIPFADKTLTEITCHGVGASYLLKDDCIVIDIGGQDTKIISVEKGNVVNFIMNDKCSAGTGKFLEIMANNLGITLENLIELAKKGENIKISSMCTVFAESEIISLIGKGEKIENIANGIVNSVIEKVSLLCQKYRDKNRYFLTGGLSKSNYIREELERYLNKKIETDVELGRYTGAIGASLLAKKIK